MVSSSPAWTNTAGILSNTADFAIHSDLTAASTSPRRMGNAPQSVSVGSQVLLDPHQSHCC